MRLLIAFVTVFSLFSLNGCGVKPKQLDKPADKQNTPYPRTYPNPDGNK